MTTIDGEAFVKGDAVIPDYMIERELDQLIEAFLGASNAVYVGSALDRPIILYQYTYTAQYYVRHGCR